MIFIAVNDRMNFLEETYYDNSNTLKLIGSQVNLTPRSVKTVLVFNNRSSRPCSAVSTCRTKTEYKTNDLRPKSADYRNSSPACSKSHQRSFNIKENNMTGSSSLDVSHFTDSSSKLLQDLIETSKQKAHFCEMFLSRDTDFAGAVLEKPENQILENGTTQEYLDMENQDGFLTEGLTNESELQNSSQEHIMWIKKHSSSRNPVVKEELSEVTEVKTVRFSKRNQLDVQSDKEFNQQVNLNYFKDFKNCSLYVKNDFNSLLEEAEVHQKWIKKIPEKPKMLELELRGANTDEKNKSDTLKSLHFSNEDGILKSNEKNNEMLCEKCEISPKDLKKFETMLGNSQKILELPNIQQNVETEICPAENKCHEIPVRNDEDIEKGCNKSIELNDWKVGSDNIHKKIDVSDSTYEDIVHLLQTLDEEDSESLSSENKELAVTVTLTSPEENMDYLTAVSSYLEEIEKDNNNLHYHNQKGGKLNSASFTSPTLDELLNKNSMELAQEVFSLKIQIEDQKKGIKLLRDTLTELKEANKLEKLEHQEALHKVTSDAEALVQRHQKLIKQLLNEKKNLNETVSKLVQDLKSGEERYKRNIKAMEDKHLIEIKRAKEVQAVADKIKREKWMENKTQKIKEMTVKGLEPELSRMAVRQQEEITELRNLHKAELEALELRAARRNSELMDELRAELTKEKERAIAKETASLRSVLENNFEDEKNKLQHYCQNLKDRIRKIEESLLNQELEFQQRLIDYKQEEEKKKQKMTREHQENLEETRRQHSVELKHLKESAEIEKEVLLNNYKKQQAAKNLEREAELHQQYKRERDKEIELVIETLEKESSQLQSELNAANENKLKRLKDKMEAEIKELEVSEAALQVKISEAKSKLSEKEDFITELKSQIRQLQTELTFVKKSCEEMSSQKTKLKEIIREEFENAINSLNREKENLQKDITLLKELHLKELAKKDQQNFQAKYEMQKELTRVYSRIKTVVSKKEKIIESLREKNETANQKCRQLELMLDQQRRNLLLH